MPGMTYRVLLDKDHQRVAASWRVTIDPESEHRRRTYDVPVDGLISFIASAFARGTIHVLLFDGKQHVRVSRTDNRGA
jgi:hypothetical protein